MAPQGHSDRSKEINITKIEVSQLPQIIDNSAEI